ncbi:MAG TPA: Omp28-related outer membrane protein [Taishania sp.]|nr:Omp28-related outer membrane protein [Taishania sp.]
MKRTLLFVFGFSGLGFITFSQQTPVSQSPQKKVALLEELTGINCQYCPDGHRMANNLANANPGKVVLVNVHAGGYANPGSGQPDLRTTAGTALNTFFDPDGYPTGTVQRTRYGSEPSLATDRTNWSSLVNTTINQDSPVNIAMNAEIDASTRQLVVTVEMYYTTPQAAGTNHYLNIGILQNNYEGPQVGSSYNSAAVLPNGKYLHQHMFRGYVNNGGTWGEAIDASQSGVITKTVTYTLPANINNIPLSIGDLEFFAFLHEGKNGVSNSKVVTAAKVSPTYVNVPTATANANTIVNNMLVCSGQSVAPIVKVVNSGDEITSLEFSTSIGGETPQTYSWTGSIPQFGIKEITLPAMVVTSATNTTVAVTITSVNGGQGQIGTATTTRAINVVQGTANSSVGQVKIKTDNYGSETSWKIYNSNNTVVAQGGPYANQTSQQADVNFNIEPNECYRIVLKDSYGDGFTGSYGNGKFEVFSGGELVVAITNFTTDEKVEGFQSAAVLATDALSELTSLTIYPNPASENINLSFEAMGGEYAIEITDLQGRVIKNEIHSNLEGQQNLKIAVDNLKAGNYLVSVRKDGGSFTKMIAIQ